MAVHLAGIAATDGPQVTGSDVVFATNGTALDASNVVQVNWDSTVFVGQEGKQRLVAALELIVRRVQTAKLFPVTASS